MSDKIPFDYLGAKEAGYSDDEIMQLLKKEFSFDFDIAGAKKSGYSDKEIADYISAAPTPKKKDLFGGVTTYAGQLAKGAGKVLGAVKTGLETVAAASIAEDQKIQKPRTAGEVPVGKIEVKEEVKLDPNDLVGSFKKTMPPLFKTATPTADATYVKPRMEAIFSEQERVKPEIAKNLQKQSQLKELKDAFLTDQDLAITQLMRATGLSANQIRNSSRDELKKMVRPGNETDLLSSQVVADANDYAKAISNARDLREAAILYQAEKDPQVARQIEITSSKLPARNLQEVVSGTKDVMANPESMFGEATIGRMIYQLATDPVAVKEIERNPELRKEFRETIPTLINKYPDFGKKYLGNIISQKMEDMGMNSALLTVVTKEDTDKAVESLLSEGKITPNEVQFYKDNMREGGFKNFAKSILGEQLYKTPGFIERTIESGVRGLKATGTGIAELSGLRESLVGERKMVGRDILAKDLAVNVNPKSTINEITSYGGDILGNILPTAFIGRGLAAAKLFKNPDNAIKALFGLQAYGNYIPQARAMFPDDKLKQRAYASVLSGVEVVTENIFRDKKIVDGIVGKIKPNVTSAINRFTDKQISAAAAQETIEGAVKNAIKSVPQFTKYLGKGIGESTSEEVLSQLGQQVTEGIFTGKRFDDYVNGEELFETARTTILGSPFIASLSARADMLPIKGMTAKMIYQKTENPNYWIDVIKENAKIDPELAATADNEISNLEYATKVRQDLEATNLTEKQKIKYLINALEANVKAKNSQAITDPVLKKRAEEEAKAIEQQQNDILNGVDQGEIEGDRSDEVVEPGEVAPEVPKPTKEQELKDIQEGNIVTFNYESDSDVPEVFKDKISSKGEINGKPFVKVSVAKSLADYELAKAGEVAPEVPAKAPVTSVIEVKSPKEIKQGDTIVWRDDDFIVDEVNSKGGFNIHKADDPNWTVKDARITDEEFQGKRGEVAAAPKLEKFGIGFAPFREKNVFTEAEDVDIRNSPDYKLHQENVQKVAEGLGIKINNKLDTWGGYVDFQTGRPVQEVSNMMEIEATPEQARLMAAILGKAAPEMQDSILVGNYNEKGAGLQHTVKTGSFANAQEALKLLKDNGLEYFSVDKNTGDVIIIDQKSTDTPKIINLVKQLNENGIPAKHKFGKVDAEFVDSGQYDRIIEAERGRVGAETGFDIDAFVQEAAGKYDAIKAAAKPIVADVQKSIADKIRGLKIDLSKLGGGAAQSNIAGLPVALYNTVVEAVALAVEAGVSINKAIKDAIAKYNLNKQEGFDEDAFASSLLKESKSIEAEDSPVYFDNLKKFASESSFANKIEFKKAIQNLLQSYLPKLKEKYGKAFKPSDYNDNTKKYLSDVLTKEALNAISEHPEAIGWYDDKTQSALDVISAIHPEIATDSEARGAFILPLAVMSNGNKVDFNFDLAEKQYDYFKKNGRFNPDGNFGLQQSGIKKSLMLINSLLDSGLTMSDINKFLTSKYRAGDLKVKIDGKIKNLASGELADELVYGATILGPKIGNGFYMNLWGQFDQLTMDRWFMRTWGRHTNTLLEIDKQAIADGKKRLSDAINTVKSDPDALAKLKSVVGKLSGMSSVDLAKSIEKASMDKDKRAILASNPKTDELRKAGNSLSKTISGEKEAPANGKERKFIRDVFNDVVSRLKSEHGIEISMADLQAALWYPEKILYESFKGGKTFEEAAEGYTSESAPDYLNAAKKLATKLGINETEINQALSRGRGRAERGIGAADTGVGPAISESDKEILGRVTEAIGGPRGPEGLEKAAKTVRSLKIKQGGLQANIAGIPIALYNAALETIATALEAGASLKGAIDQAIKKHKLNKQKGFNVKEFIKPLEDASGQTYPKVGGEYAIQIETAGEVPVQPEARVSKEMEGRVPPTRPEEAPKEGKVEGKEGEVVPPVPPTETPKVELPRGGEERKKAFLNAIMGAKGTPEAAKEGMKKEGLNYKTSSQKEARELANSIVEELGIDEALDIARKRELYDGDVNAFVMGRALEKLADLETTATSPQEKQKYAERFAEIAIAQDEMARSGGRFNAAIGDFYRKSPLGVVLYENAKRQDNFTDWSRNKEESWKDFYARLMEEPEFAEVVGKEVSEKVKAEKAQEAKVGDTIRQFAEKVRSGKISKLGGFKAGTGFDAVWDASLEVVAKALEGGASIADAIEAGLKYVKGTEWYKNLTDKKEFDDKYRIHLGEEYNVVKKRTPVRPEVYEKGYRKKLENQIKDIDEQLAEMKRKPKVEKEKREYQEETKKLIEERNAKKKQLDEAIPVSKGISPESILKRFRKKLEGLSDKEKQEVVRNSFAKIVESGGLDFQDFKDIIAKVTGRGEMTPEQAAKIKELVGKTNAVESAAQRLQEIRTPEAYKEYKIVQLEAAKSAAELNEMLDTKVNISERINALIQLNTLGALTLLTNPLLNAINQMGARFPVHTSLSLIDKGIGAAAKAVGGKYEVDPGVLSLQAQKDYFKNLGLGFKESFEQLWTGLNRQDYTQKELTTQRIRPLKAWESLFNIARHKQKASTAQIIDKTLQALPGIPAEAVARTLNLGDKPFRFGTEALWGSAFAKKLGLTDIDYTLFLEFPREEAYRQYKKRGLSDKEAAEKADYVKDVIVQEGKKATFTQDNILNDLVSALFENKAFGGTGSIIKTLTISPYIKVPANFWWSYYNMLNPEVALLQAMYYGGKSVKQKGSAKKMSLREARYWFGHAAVGIATKAVIYSLVQAGIVNPGSDEEETKKEREGKRQYTQPGTINIDKLQAFSKGKNPDEVKGGLEVPLKYFGHFGQLSNAMGKQYENMTPEERQAKREFWDYVLGKMELEGLKELQDGIFSNASSLLAGIKDGNLNLRRYGANMINLLTNVVQPATIAQISRAELPYQTTTKADDFLGEIKNGMLQRSSKFRKLIGEMPPARRGVWGDTLTRDGGTIQKMFSITRANDDAFAAPVWELYKKTGDIGYFPATPLSVLNGVKLNAEQTDKLQEYVGKARQFRVAPIVNDEADIYGYGVKFSQLNDEDKKFALNYEYELGKNIGVERFYEDYPELAPKEKEVDMLKNIQKKLFMRLEKYR